MELGLQNKNVLVTGGSKGIGFACARAFLAEGARVALVSRSEANLGAAKKALGGATYVVAADLTNWAAAGAMVERVEMEFGPLDVLVNSAGMAKRHRPEELTPEAWHAGMEAKYFSYVHVIDPVIKRMAARGRGAIINIIGSGGKVASPSHLSGGAANAALMLITAGLAAAYSEKGIRIIGLNPGPTNTTRVRESMKVEAKRLGVTEDEALKRITSTMLLGRMAEPEEVADIALFAASERARLLTGSNISVDGGALRVVI